MFAGLNRNAARQRLGISGAVTAVLVEAIPKISLRDCTGNTHYGQ